jgi:hypothetical protein
MRHIVVFVNGLPLGLIELKNAADEDVTIWSAWAVPNRPSLGWPRIRLFSCLLPWTCGGGGRTAGDIVFLRTGLSTDSA